MLTCPSCRVAIPPASNCPFCGAAVFPPDSTDSWLDSLAFSHLMQRPIDRERERLRAIGKIASGTVKEVWPESTRYYNVTYSFVPAGHGTSVERTETVFRGDWLWPAVGQRVDVVYDPSSPNYSALANLTPGLSPEQEQAAAHLLAGEAWIEAYRALPPEQQALQREEFQRRFLDHAERLLTSSSLVGIDPDGPMLWAVRRTKELLASAVPFNDAAAMALDEMEQRFPSQRLDSGFGH